MTTVTVDRPKGYVTRVTESKPLQAPVDISSFGNGFLPVLVQVFCLKMTVKAVVEVMKRQDKETMLTHVWRYQQ
jgi:hypothetical protein